MSSRFRKNIALACEWKLHLTLPYIKEGVEELLRDARFVWQTEPLGAETRVVSGLISDGVQFICVTMWLTIDINDVKPKVQISDIVDMRTAFLWRANA